MCFMSDNCLLCHFVNTGGADGTLCLSCQISVFYVIL